MDAAGRFRRVAGATMLVAAALALAATGLFLAAGGFDLQKFVEPSRLLGIGSSKVETLRWGSIADMLVYLLSIPLFVCVGSELTREHGPAAYVLAVSGVLYAIVGALAATTLLYAAAPLLHAYAAAPSNQRAGIALAFTALTDVIYRGLWTTLELIPLGSWAIGTGITLRSRRRGLGNVGIVSGIGALLVALGRFTQAPNAAIEPAFALFALTFVFQIWLAMILLRDPAGL